MALTWQELIDQAVEQTAKGRSDSDIEDLELKAESLARVALHQLSARIASNPEARALLTRTITIALTNGIGVLPSTVLLDYITNSSLTNPADLTNTYAYIRNWENFIRDPETRYGRYNIKQNTLTVIQPAAAYVVGSGLTGNVDLTTAAQLVIPTNPTDPIDNLPTVLEDVLIDNLVNLLRGA